MFNFIKNLWNLLFNSKKVANQIFCLKDLVLFIAKIIFSFNTKYADKKLTTSEILDLLNDLKPALSLIRNFSGIWFELTNLSEENEQRLIDEVGMELPGNKGKEIAINALSIVINIFQIKTKFKK